MTALHLPARCENAPIVFSLPDQFRPFLGELVPVRPFSAAFENTSAICFRLPAVCHDGPPFPEKILIERYETRHVHYSGGKKRRSQDAGRSGKSMGPV